MSEVKSNKQLIETLMIIATLLALAAIAYILFLS